MARGGADLVARRARPRGEGALDGDRAGGGEPWIASLFGGLLIVSSENALLIGGDGRIIKHDDAGWRFSAVLIGETAVWIVGDYEARRVTGGGFEEFLPAKSEWDLWRLRGDDLEARGIDGVWELLG